MLVPRALRIEGVSFPLAVTASSAHLATSVPALQALQVVLVQLCDANAPAAVRECFARGEDFVVRELAAVRMKAHDADASAGLAQWRAFARSADTTTADSDIYLVSASFVRTALAVPCAILVQLAAELVRLNDGLRAGTITAQLEPPDPADAPGAQPLAGGPPSAATLDDDGDDDSDDDSDDDDSHDDDDESHDDGPSPAHGSAAPQAPAAAEAPLPALPALPSLPSDELLRQLENEAAMLDQLDPEDTLRPGLPSEELDALTAARRRTVLLGLRVAGLLHEAADSPELRHRLASAGLSTLTGYLDAAAALRAYLRSPGRARFFRGAAQVADLLTSAVSLDWFRKDASITPPGVSPDEWLALCEANFVRSRPPGPRGGRTYVKLEGRGVWIHFRADVGPHLCLWRALQDPPRASALN